MKNQLNNSRKKIDKIDNEIIILLSKRMKEVKKIGRHKEKNQLPILDKTRFKNLLTNRIFKGKKLGMSEEFIKKICDVIHKEALKIEKSI